MLDRHQQEMSNFPIFFAFNDKQFEIGMRNFGLTPDDTDKIYKLGSTGGFYIKTDAAGFREMMDKHIKEQQDAIERDTTGDGFIFDMFCYELANHEYTYTNDLTYTLEALGLTIKDFENSEPLRAGLNKAILYLREADSK